MGLDNGVLFPFGLIESEMAHLNAIAGRSLVFILLVVISSLFICFCLLLIC